MRSRVAAKHGKLDALHIRFGSPIGFMLASPIPYGEHYPDLDGHRWFAEDKYDGIRAQAHVSAAHGVIVLAHAQRRHAQLPRDRRTRCARNRDE